MTAATAAPAVADWEEALRQVPRALFLPDRIWPYEEGTHRYVDRATDPRGWLAAAEADVPVTTQWDDGTHTGDAPGAVPSSSASQPSLVARMLQALDVAEGMRVLEIGTGTGWNAALLAHRLGDEAVTSVDVDPVVARTARRALAGAGFAPAVVVGDGMAGWPAAAPFDRVVATCGVRGVPWAWVEQTRPGGLILAPWGTAWSRVDALVRLVVAPGGGSAAGRFSHGLVQFMKSRSDRAAADLDPAAYLVGEWPHGADESTTTVSSSALADPYAAEAWVPGLLVPDCVCTYGRQQGMPVVWLYSLSDRSWAAVAWPPGEAEGDVYQYGPRRLWIEAEAAWRWWEARGRPEVGRFGLTVTAAGQEVWLDHVDQVVRTTAVASSQ